MTFVHRATDWDNVGLISQLYRLYLGDSQVQQASKKMKKASPESLRQPASLRYGVVYRKF